MLPQIRDASYQQWRNEVYETLYDAGMERVADDWLACSTNFATFELSPNDEKLPDSVKSVYVCSDHPEHYAKAVLFTCHCRACPDCARRETARLLARYMPKVDELAKKNSRRLAFRHIILTTPIDLEHPNLKFHLNKFLAAVPKVFPLLQKYDKDGNASPLLPENWRAKQGYILTAEFGSEGHRLHFHVFWYGQYIPQEELSRVWENVTGSLASVVYIRLVGFKEATDKLAEQVKYVCKFWTRDKETGIVEYFPPRLVPVLLDVLRGVRRVRSYGVFYGIKEIERESICPHCNMPLNRWSPGEWSIFAQTGWTPDEAELNLIPGNKSASSGQSRDKSPPESVPKQESF